MAARDKKPQPDLMRDFVLAWIARQPRADGEPWSNPEMAKHLGIDRVTVWAMFGGRGAAYSRHDYVPQMAAFIGQTPMQVYEGALRLWKRDPSGATLHADWD